MRITVGMLTSDKEMTKATWGVEDTERVGEKVLYLRGLQLPSLTDETAKTRGACLTLNWLKSQPR